MTDNYIDKIAVRIATELEDDNPTEYMPLYRIYALLALTSGVFTTNENIHDAWSVWQLSIDPEHRSLKPFSELTHEVQMLDTLYRDAVVDVAQDMEDEHDR